MTGLAVMLLKAAAVWGGILAIAIANGVLRERALIPAFGRTGGLVASGLILSLAVVVVAFFAVPWYHLRSPADAWLMGAFWLALTLVFEFAFGRFVQHKSWAAMLEDYRFRDGNLWPVVLVVILVAPRLATVLWMFLVTWALCATGHCQFIDAGRL